MPSDPRVARALDILADPIEQYRSAVVTTLEDVRRHLGSGRSDTAARAKRLQEELGPFAAGRIDAARLAAIVGHGEPVDATALRRLERAADTLQDLVKTGTDLFHVTVPEGGDLHACVSAQLASIGRAFSAARIASAACSGAAPALDENVALDRFPFSQWTAAERQLAPPLVVSVSGRDLVAGALAPFLDGMQKILLIVDGPCAPAPLVRLITPAVLVIQAHDADELGVLAGWPGTAVAALVPEPALRFVHDPAAGAAPWQRLSVTATADPPVARVGSVTAAQQLEELRQLETLAAAPAAPPLTTAASSVAAVPAGDPADRLAVWLLRQANLAGASAVD